MSASRQVRSGALPTVSAPAHGQLVLGHSHGQRQEFHHLMAPDPATTAAGRFRERLLTMPTALRHHCHDFIHLLHRQQRAASPRVPGLATALPARGRQPALCRGLRWIRRGRTRGIGRALAESSFQLADPLVQHGVLRPQRRILRAQRSVLPAERRQLLQQRSRVRGPSRRRWRPSRRPQHHAHAAVVERRGSWGKQAWEAAEGGPERLPDYFQLFRPSVPPASLLRCRCASHSVSLSEFALDAIPVAVPPPHPFTYPALVGSNDSAAVPWGPAFLAATMKSSSGRACWRLAAPPSVAAHQTRCRCRRRKGEHFPWRLPLRIKRRKRSVPPAGAPAAGLPHELRRGTTAA
jgi:hypothetical protein